MNIEARHDDLGSSARQLAAAAEPVFIFDGKSPVLVWANAAALAFVGHAAGPGAQLPNFDRAMPAMARLRGMADGTVPPAGLRAELVFWTPLGARTLACICRRATFAFAPEALIVLGSVATADVEASAAPEPAAAPQPVSKRAKPKDSQRDKRERAEVRGRKATAAKRRTTNARRKAVAAEPALTAAAAQLAPQAAQLLPLADTQPAPQPTGEALALQEIARQITAGTRRTAAEAMQPPPVATAPAPPPQVDFLAQIGHEIRTPLNSILGFAEIMREERFGTIGNARYKTYAADIHESASHALGLINDLLDLSRIEAGGLQLEPVELDVAAVITQATASVQPLAEKAGVGLSAPAGRPLPRLVCDARGLKQMLFNLLSNAIKHTDPGGAVWIMAAVGDDGGLVVRVQDTGVGMRAEEIVLALEPYKQVGSAERRTGGSGLGLPLTKAMAEANGGHLRLERIAGGGLAALLLFPATCVVKS